MGETYGWWTVISDKVEGKGAYRTLLCECRCGVRKRVYLNGLRSGGSKSCGACGIKAVPRTHGDTMRGTGPSGYSKLYGVWNRMKQRCENPKARDYGYYGGDGIQVCEEWHDYSVFRTWALSHGYREGLTINRIDNNGDYEPGNCNWTTRKAQMQNTRRTVLVTAWGETKPFTVWLEDPRCRVDRGTLRARLHVGWSSEPAMSTRVRKPSE